MRIAAALRILGATGSVLLVAAHGVACLPNGSACDRPAAACPATGSATETGSDSGSATTGGSATTQAGSTQDGSGDSVDSSTTEVLDCHGASLRVATFNVKSVGFEGSDEWNALGSVLARLQPDVVCIEELADGETAPLRALTMSLGWSEPIQADPSPAIGGELRNACMSPHAISRIDSYSGEDLSSDQHANDVGRDFLGVRIVIDDCAMGLLAVHAKSGQEDLDRFRRQVEFERLRQAIDDMHARHPGEPLVVMGDFNENTDDPSLGQVFDAPPVGLPRSYRLGSDIALPMTYDPFTTVSNAGLTAIDATHEDSSRIGTWGVSAGSDGVRIDYIWLDGPQLVNAIVYDACRDDGVDEPPAGQWLALAGDPVPCVASALASDHLPVVADITLLP
ncbi:MAG: endonuclease/exonuclease/phosphatase family protein [Deltaproteobacteria bacterium]|nr:endonuclease/exonuclease/phosphatase family protein [Deltaproteobacteria bacterium]